MPCRITISCYEPEEIDAVIRVLSPILDSEKRVKISRTKEHRYNVYLWVSPLKTVEKKEDLRYNNTSTAKGKYPE